MFLHFVIAIRYLLENALLKATRDYVDEIKVCAMKLKLVHRGPWEADDLSSSHIFSLLYCPISGD